MRSAARHSGYLLSKDRFTWMLRAHPNELMKIVLDRAWLQVADLSLTDPHSDLVRIAQTFGLPIPYNGSGASPCIELSNSASTPEAERNKAVEWHQDDIHTPAPASFTMLYCLEAPLHPPATLMADLAGAFHDLAESAKKRLDGLLVRHDPLGGVVESEGETRGRLGHQRGEGLVVHPLVLQHPRTAVPQLFGLAGTAAGIMGKPDEEARQILRELKAHVTGAEYLTQVRLTAGSLVIFDNLALLHAATPLRYSDRDMERRRLLRVSVR